MYRLIVTDDDYNYLSRMVRYMDWQALNIEVVGQAQDGKEALEMCSTLSPDILLTDVKMPHVSGMELARYVREHLNLCQIIFMSVYSEKDDLKTAIKMRAIDYIEKPVDIAALNDALLRAISILKENRREYRSKTYSRAIEDVMQYILQNFHEDLTIEFLASQVYLSTNYLSSRFKAETGKTINQYITGLRLEQAKVLLKESAKSVAEIAAAVGYSDERYFSKLFAREVGMTPTQFRR